MTPLSTLKGNKGFKTWYIFIGNLKIFHLNVVYFHLNVVYFHLNAVYFHLNVVYFQRDVARREQRVDQLQNEIQLQIQEKESVTRALKQQISDLHERLRVVGERGVSCLALSPHYWIDVVGERGGGGVAV